MPSRELFGLRVEILRLPLELAADESMHTPSMPEGGDGGCALLVGPEQEPLPKLLTKPAVLPPLRNVRVTRERPVTSSCLRKVSVFLLPPLPGPLACLWAGLRQ